MAISSPEPGCPIAPEEPAHQVNPRTLGEVQVAYETETCHPTNQADGAPSLPFIISCALACLQPEVIAAATHGHFYSGIAPAALVQTVSRPGACLCDSAHAAAGSLQLVVVVGGVAGGGVQDDDGANRDPSTLLGDVTMAAHAMC